MHCNVTLIEKYPNETHIKDGIEFPRGEVVKLEHDQVTPGMIADNWLIKEWFYTEKELKEMDSYRLGFFKDKVRKCAEQKKAMEAQAGCTRPARKEDLVTDLMKMEA